MNDWTNIWAVLTWIAYGPGAGTVTYLIMDKIRWSPDATAEAKRWSAIAMTIAIGCASWIILVLAGKQPIPADFLSWFTQLFSVGASAYIISQGIHTARDLHQKALREKEERCACEGSCTCK